MIDQRAAAVAMQSRFGDIEGNLARMEVFVREAARKGASVICFPELSISGYALKDEIHRIAEPVPGPSTHKVQQMARENGILILAGLFERVEKGTAITHIVVAPDGCMGKYRKLHLSLGERALLCAGSETPVFRYAGTCFGIELCYDAHFPELSTILALKGAEIIYMPHASPPPESPDEKRNRWLRYLGARAYDNSAFVVACNQAGDGAAGIRFGGVALALDPRGDVLAEASGDEESMIMADLKSESLARTRNARMGFFLMHRRPELYSRLLAGITDEGPAPSAEYSDCLHEAKLTGRTNRA